MIEPSERDERVMALAAEALKAPAGDRDSFLENACQKDLELFREVSEVVAWEERMSGFLVHPLIEFVDLKSVEKIFEPGQTVDGRFEILRCVGEGGMGVVYEAFDTKLNERIAIKLAKPGFDRLLAPEVKRSLKVSHTNVCRVKDIHSTKVDIGIVDFLTMEFLDGETLASRLARGKLDETEAFEIACQLCAAVAQAHQSDVLHGDLKPGNVMLCRNKDGDVRVVITDFGLSTESTVANEVRGGTRNYMAPELLQGGKPSQDSDIFALGVILYELVTGQKPFPATTGGNGTARSPMAPSKLVKKLPRRWDAVILPCLRPEPEERCTAEQILGTLERKPFYEKPGLMVAVAARLVLVAVAIAVLWLVAVRRPPAVPSTPAMRLAMLPPEGPADLIQKSRGILDEAAARVKQMQTEKATVSVIPLSQALNKGVTRPQEAGKALGATHALQLRFRPIPGGLAVDGALIDLSAMSQVRDYSGQFAEADLADLPTAIAGSISLALHLPRRVQPETVAVPASVAYKTGREYLDGDPQDYLQAMHAFEEAARLDSHSPLPLAGLAEAYTRKYQDLRDEKSKQEAELWLARAEVLNADSPAVRIASGLLHLIEGDNARALEDYRRVEEIQPGNVEAWLGSAFVYKSQQMREKAIAEYRHAISVAPDNYKPYQYLGELYFNSGQYDLAEAPFATEVKLAPQRADGSANLVGVYVALFKYADAERVSENELQREGSTKNPDVLNNMGALRAFQGRQEEAIGYYRQAIATNPNLPAYWLNLGDSQRRLGDAVHARNSYQHGLEAARRQVTANASSAQARAFMAYLEARLGFKQEAQSEIAAALNSPASDAQVLLSAVQTYEVLGDRERALAAAAKATAQTRAIMAHHPDLGDFVHDSRFKP